MGRRIQCRQRQAIGAFEVLAAVGLVLPAALGIAPVLVPLAALGLVMITVGAVITRIRRHEFRSWWKRPM
jgi:DoxX-like family